MMGKRLFILFFLLAQVFFANLLIAKDFSSSFLGLYRKTMRIEDRIKLYSEKYDVDPQLSRAICLYESGGNGNLTSWAGAKGYFQVMPKTFRSLKVKTNIEAGIKYFSIQVKKYDREDYALAAYNGGPLYVERNRPFKLETLQYVIGIGYFRSVLKLHEPAIRERASRLLLHEVKKGEDWLDISRATKIPIIQLRMYNPFLSHREKLQPGFLIAYPPVSENDPFRKEGDTIYYTSRIGDNYLHLVFIFDMNLDRFREMNRVWRLQSLMEGTLLQFRFEEPENPPLHVVTENDTLESLAKQHNLTPWDIIHGNSLLDQELVPGETIRLAEIKITSPSTGKSKAKFFYYRIKRGDTLHRIAGRFNTSVGAIQRANNMRGMTRIRSGKLLKIPMS